MNWQEIVIKIAIGVATALIAALGSWVLVKVKTFISTKIKNTKLAELLTGVLDVVESAVKATYQTYVESIKGTDKWDIDAQKTALLNALNMTKAQLSDKVKKQIESMYGNIDTYLTTQIESTLYELKNK